MPIPGTDSAEDGPTGRKRFTVSRTNNLNDITSDVISLTEDHNFINGESVRVISDDGSIPDGLVHNSLYFVITDTKDGTLSSNEIKLGQTFNDATVGDTFPVSIKNKTGGILTIESRVTDKKSGDIGHPIQYDSTNDNWYIVGSATTAKNTINQALIDNRATLSNQTIRPLFKEKLILELQ